MSDREYLCLTPIKPKHPNSRVLELSRMETNEVIHGSILRLGVVENRTGREFICKASS